MAFGYKSFWVVHDADIKMNLVFTSVGFIRHRCSTVCTESPPHPWRGLIKRSITLEGNLFFVKPNKCRDRCARTPPARVTVTVSYPQGRPVHSKGYLAAKAFSGGYVFIHSISQLQRYLFECFKQGVNRQSVISLQTSSHSDYVIQSISEALVEFYRIFVLCPDLDVYLWTTDFSQ